MEIDNGIDVSSNSSIFLPVSRCNQTSEKLLGDKIIEEISYSSDSDVSIHQDSSDQSPHSQSSPKKSLQKFKNSIFDPKSLDVALPIIKEEVISSE